MEKQSNSLEIAIFSYVGTIVEARKHIDRLKEEPVEKHGQIVDDLEQATNNLMTALTTFSNSVVPKEKPTVARFYLKVGYEFIMQSLAVMSMYAQYGYFPITSEIPSESTSREIIT